MSSVSEPGFVEKLSADMEPWCTAWQRPKGLSILLRLMLLEPGFQLVFLLRVEEVLGRVPKVGILLRRIVWYFTVFWFSADIDPHARFGPGLYLPHPIGVAIGGHCTFGRNVMILQGVTLGRGSDKRDPVVGNNVEIHAGAKIFGGIVIGDGASVGANAVVRTDVPPGWIAVGVPAQVRPRKVKPATEASA